MNPVDISRVDEDEEVIIGFCESCGVPVTKEESKEVTYKNRKLVVKSCEYC